MSPTIRVFEGTIGEGASHVLSDSQTIALPASVHAAKPALRGYANRSVLVGIGPEDLPILKTDEILPGSGSAVFEGDVNLVEALGSELLVHFTSDAHLIEAEGAKVSDAEGLNARAGPLEKAKAWPASRRERNSQPGAVRAFVSTQTDSTSSTPRPVRPSPAERLGNGRPAAADPVRWVLFEQGPR